MLMALGEQGNYCEKEERLARLHFRALSRIEGQIQLEAVHLAYILSMWNSRTRFLLPLTGLLLPNSIPRPDVAMFVFATKVRPAVSFSARCTIRLSHDGCPMERN